MLRLHFLFLILLKEVRVHFFSSLVSRNIVDVSGVSAQIGVDSLKLHAILVKLFLF